MTPTVDLAACAVKVFHNRRPSGDVAGTAILVDSRHVVTCAHVVEQAIGVGDTTHLSKPDATGSCVDLELGALIGQPHGRTGTVIDWYNVIDNDTGYEPSDIAVIRFDRTTDITIKDDLWSQYQPSDTAFFYGFGSTDLWVECQCMGTTTNFTQLNCRQHEALPGYSGGPVFNRTRQTLIGMLVASNSAKRVAKMIDSRVLVRVLSKSNIRSVMQPQHKAPILQPLDRQAIAMEFALTFDTPDLSAELLEQINYPRARVPRFDRPLEFWRAVLQDIEQGMVAGGIPRLVAAATVVFPYHPVFGNGRSTPGTA